MSNQTKLRAESGIQYQLKYSIKILSKHISSLLLVKLKLCFYKHFSLMTFSNFCDLFICKSYSSISKYLSK